MKRLILIMAIFALLLCGCTACPAPTGNNFSVVTGVNITHYLGDVSTQRQYHAEENMEMVLNYLRLLRTLGKPVEDPEAEAGGVFHITVTFSNGSTKQYAQKADRYLWEEGVGWQLIDPEQAPQLGQLFRALPSDEIN